MQLEHHALGKLASDPVPFSLSHYYDYGGSTRTCCPQTKGWLVFCQLCLSTFLSKSYWRWLQTRNPLSSPRKRYFLECLVTRVLRRARVSSFQAFLLLLKSQKVRKVMNKRHLSKYTFQLQISRLEISSVKPELAVCLLNTRLVHQSLELTAGHKKTQISPITERNQPSDIFVTSLTILNFSKCLTWEMPWIILLLADCNFFAKQMKELRKISMVHCRMMSQDTNVSWSLVARWWSCWRGCFGGTEVRWRKLEAAAGSSFLPLWAVSEQPAALPLLSH